MSVLAEGFIFVCDVCHSANHQERTKTRLRRMAKEYGWRIGPNWLATCPSCVSAGHTAEEGHRYAP